MRYIRAEVFCIQAEDGIRDLVRSRGLGDVYKRQEPTSGLDPNQIIEIRQLIKDLGKEKTVILSTHIPVSYTHLTLPTSDLV